jgi:hypothetical protein
MYFVTSFSEIPLYIINIRYDHIGMTAELTILIYFLLNIRKVYIHLVQCSVLSLHFLPS